MTGPAGGMLRTSVVRPIDDGCTTRDCHLDTGGLPSMVASCGMPEQRRKSCGTFPLLTSSVLVGTNDSDDGAGSGRCLPCRAPDAGERIEHPTRSVREPSAVTS
jgi:hypothetical protein